MARVLALILIVPSRTLHEETSRGRCALTFVVVVLVVALRVTVPTPPSAWLNERNYSLSRIPLDAKTADFTFAVHQSHFVEFTVHPELPAPATNSAGR